MTTKTTYHVVTTADGVIFAVYGETMLEVAKLYAKRLTDTTGVHRVPYYVDTVTRTRKPIVGNRL